MNTTENNKLIAEFMGLPFIVFEGETNYIRDLQHVSEDQLDYDSDWNWLMEVVEKIESLGYWTSLNSGSDHWFRIGKLHLNHSLIEFSCKTKIETVYNAAVKFIQWYNENHKGVYYRIHQDNN